MTSSHDEDYRENELVSAKKKNGQNLRGIWKNIKWSNIHEIGGSGEKLRINTKETVPMHLLIKLLKNKNKEKN